MYYRSGSKWWSRQPLVGALAALVLLSASCDKLGRGDADESGPAGDGDKGSTVEGAQPADDHKLIETVVENSFTGTWKTGWGKVSLEQNGSLVTGSYSGRFRGTLKGEAKGDEAELTWTQTNGEHGKARFTLSADRNSFKGTWGPRSSYTSGGAWNGTRTD